MKKLFFKGIAAAAACVMMFTSCLDSGDNNIDGNGYGIISTSGTRPVLYWSAYDYPVYSNDLILASEGPVYYYIQIDRDSPDNADVATKGYYLGNTSHEALETISTGYSRDPEIPLEGEVTLSAVEAGLYANYWQIFGLSLSTYTEDEKYSFYFDYDRDQEAENINSKKVHKVYVRAIKTEEGKENGTSGTNVGAVLGVNWRNIINNIQSKGDINESNGIKTVDVQINYVQSFNSDTTEIAWKSLESPLGFIVE